MIKVSRPRTLAIAALTIVGALTIPFVVHAQAGGQALPRSQAEFDQQVGITPDQKAKLKAIKDKYDAQLQAIQKKFVAEATPVQQAEKKEMDAVFSPAQREKIKKIQAAFLQRQQEMMAQQRAAGAPGTAPKK